MFKLKPKIYVVSMHQTIRGQPTLMIRYTCSQKRLLGQSDSDLPRFDLVITNLVI